MEKIVLVISAATMLASSAVYALSTCQKEAYSQCSRQQASKSSESRNDMSVNEYCTYVAVEKCGM